jgi:ABC-type amino acid transport system permease subunit
MKHPDSMDRVVLRLFPELRQALDVLAARLTNETGVAFPRAAVLRGLIGLGIAAVAGHATLTPIFIPSRVARGAKKGQKHRRAASLAEGTM